MLLKKLLSIRVLPRRGNRTQPGVLTPGTGLKTGPPSQDASKSSSCSCSKSGVGLAKLLEYRALSELHPVLGLAVLKGRQIGFAKVNETSVKYLPPLQGGSSFGRVPGVRTPGLVLLPLRGRSRMLMSPLKLALMG